MDPACESPASRAKLGRGDLHTARAGRRFRGAGCGSTWTDVPGTLESLPGRSLQADADQTRPELHPAGTSSVVTASRRGPAGAGPASTVTRDRRWVAIPSPTGGLEPQGLKPLIHSFLKREVLDEGFEPSTYEVSVRRSTI